MMMQHVSAILVAVVVATPSIAAQTNASKASAGGTWTLDVQHSDLGTAPAPKSMTLTILEDTPQHYAWRVDATDDKAQSASYSWSGPPDGSMQPIKGPDGAEIGKESLKRSGDVMVRHGEDLSDGSSFDARATMSTDGNTITDVVTMKLKDGSVSKITSVMHRSTGGR